MKSYKLLKNSFILSRKKILALFREIIYKCFSSNLIYKSNTYFSHLLITLANSFNPDQGQQIVRPDLDPNCLNILIAFKKWIRFLECSWNHIFRVPCICGNFTFETLILHVRESTLEKAWCGKRNMKYSWFQKSNLLLLFTFYYLKYRNHL